MRNCFYLLLVLCTLLTVAAASPPSTLPPAASCFPSPAGLSAWWPGDGNTNDIVGGRGASFHGHATTGPGLVAQAFALDGDGDFVEVPHDPALNLGTGDFTVALWVNFDHTSGEQVLIEAWVQRSSTRSDPSEGWTLTKLEDNVIRLALSSGTDADTNVDSAPLTIPTDTWIHFAAIRQAGEVTIFMNGEPIASGSFSGNLDSPASLKFGHRGNPDDTPGSADENGFFLNGYLDEIQLFVGTALSAEQIVALYTAGSAGMCSITQARIIASIAGDWFWTSGFKPGPVNVFIYESAAAGAPLLWQGSREANEVGFIHVLYEDHGQDFVPGHYLVVSDGNVEKGLVLETITMTVFDAETEIMAGTAPAGREVTVVAGMAEAETQGVLFVIADAATGAWSADFKSIGFDITAEMLQPSFAQIHDEDGDANEAAAPLSPPTPISFPSSVPTFHPPTVELLYPYVTGGFIELRVEPLQSGWWTRLQWQDAFGHWHDVDGWQGTFNEDGQVLWWVATEDLGTGPFRWLVTESREGDVLTMSEAFHLPAHDGEVLQVVVSVP